MANSQAFCTSAKVDALKAIVPAADTLKMALYTSAASLGAATTVYSATNEASGTNYPAGGATITHATDAAADGTTAHWTPTASVAFNDVTFTNVDAALLYNASKADRAISVFTFGLQTITAGNFTLTMPVDDGATGLLRLQ